MGAHGVGQQALAAHLQRQLAFLAAQDKLAQRDLALLLHGVAYDGEGLDARALLGNDEEGIVPIQAVDVGLVHELVDGDGLGAVQPHLVEIGVVEQDVFVLGHLIAAHQMAALHRTGVGVGRHHADAVVGVRIDQVKAHVGGAGRRGVERHRAGDERQLQVSLPCGASGHVGSPRQAKCPAPTYVRYRGQARGLPGCPRRFRFRRSPRLLAKRADSHGRP